jgi:hypothetical protein
MSTQYEFYVARAAEARADAENATLDNVRERCLRSAAAWEVMAERAGRAERIRTRQAAEHSAALAASPS